MYKTSGLKLVIFPSFNPSLVQYKIKEPQRNVSIGVDSITIDPAIFSVLQQQGTRKSGLILI